MCLHKNSLFLAALPFSLSTVPWACFPSRFAADVAIVTEHFQPCKKRPLYAKYLLAPMNPLLQPLAYPSAWDVTWRCHLALPMHFLSFFPWFTQFGAGSWGTRCPNPGCHIHLSCQGERKESQHQRLRACDTGQG